MAQSGASRKLETGQLHRANRMCQWINRSPPKIPLTFWVKYPIDHDPCLSRLPGWSVQMRMSQINNGSSRQGRSTYGRRKLPADSSETASLFLPAIGSDMVHKEWLVVTYGLSFF